MDSKFDNIEELINKYDISKRDLNNFKKIIESYQPGNDSLTSLLMQYTYRNVDKKALAMLDKTTDELFDSLEYPIEDDLVHDVKKLDGYKLIKDCIIEYCTTNIKNIAIVIENVAFLNNKKTSDVKKSMQLYMSNFGSTEKVMNIFSKYSDDYRLSIRKSIQPEIYIPIYSKAVVGKIQELKASKKK